jgi:hypothetical protein
LYCTYSQHHFFFWDCIILNKWKNKSTRLSRSHF